MNEERKDVHTRDLCRVNLRGTILGLSYSTYLAYESFNTNRTSHMIKPTLYITPYKVNNEIIPTVSSDVKYDTRSYNCLPTQFYYSKIALGCTYCKTAAGGITWGLLALMVCKPRYIHCLLKT